MNYKKFIPWAVGAVIVLLLFLFFFRNTKPAFVTQEAKKEDLVEAFVVSGNVSSGSQSALTPPINGVIREVFVKNGDQVKQGDPLYSLTSTATDAEKAQAYANYATALSSVKVAEQNKLTAQTQLEEARRQTITAENDYQAMISRQTNPDTKQAYTQTEKDKFTSQITSSQENFKAYEKKYVDADTAIQSARAQLSSAWQTYKGLQDTRVMAPTGGTVANMLLKPGDSVTLASGDPVLFIVSPTGYHVSVQLNEGSIVKTAEGDRVTVSFDALPDVLLQGILSTIDTVGTNNQGIVTYNANIDLIKPDRRIRPGLTAYATIETGRVKNAITVPSIAIVPYEGSDAVRVVTSPNAKKFTYQKVKLGTKGTTKTQILSGLKPGTLVVIEEKK